MSAGGGWSCGHVTPTILVEPIHNGLGVGVVFTCSIRHIPIKFTTCPNTGIRVVSRYSLLLDAEEEVAVESWSEPALTKTNQAAGTLGKPGGANSTAGAGAPPTSKRVLEETLGQK